MKTVEPLRSAAIVLLAAAAWAGQSDRVEVRQTDQRLIVETPQLRAAVNKTGFISGVAPKSFVDKRTGHRSSGHGLAIADFILEPGSDRPYRQKLGDRMRYQYGNLIHGNRPKRKVEGPQICTQMSPIAPKVIRGDGFVAVVLEKTFTASAPQYETGSTWRQTLLFPEGKRYFFSHQRIHSVNDVNHPTFRIDLPGHVFCNEKHGDTYKDVYLSYASVPRTEAYGASLSAWKTIPAGAFAEAFPPEAKFHYVRDDGYVPERMIRAYRPLHPETGEAGPWLAGMVLDPAAVDEAWCHARWTGGDRPTYVCMILEFGGRPVNASESFGVVNVIGWFDSTGQMNRVYDRHKGHRRLHVDQDGWRLGG